MRPTLTVDVGGREAVVPADRTFVVGRGLGADIVLPDSLVSRRHLLIEPVGEGWTVRDVSSGGTWMAGRRVRRLAVQDEIRLRLGAPSGPELTLRRDTTDPADGRDADGRDTADGTRGLTGNDSELATLRPDSPEYGQRVAARHWGGPVGRSGPVGQGQVDGLRDKGADGGYAPRTVHRLGPGVMSIGRSKTNDIVVDDLLVSRTHAELLIGRGGTELVDLGSANGTFLNGRRVGRAIVVEGDLIAVGHHTFQLVGGELAEHVDAGDVTFEADRLSVYADGHQILREVSFRLPRRALLAVIGPSGAGKSTLLDAITGFRPADSGTVRYAGRNMYTEYDELRRRIGYVPQNDILHVSLTVRQALEYGARLRFPADTTAGERRARVNEVLAELGLTDRTEPSTVAGSGHEAVLDAPANGDAAALADRQVAKLSGGQRKRTSVALELLTEPTLLYLDEPTSGLDPGLDQEAVGSLRRLADDGRTVVVVTHSVAQLHVCDYVLVLAEGGRTAYFGPPSEALPFFGSGDWAAVFRMLKTPEGARRAAARFRESPYNAAAALVASPARPVPAELPSIRQQSVFSQLVTLSSRSLSVMVSDRSYLRLIIAFPVLLGLVPWAVPAPHGLGPAESGAPNRDATLVLLVVILCACFMGTANSVREIVKERAIYRRERAIGLSLAAYVGSKVLVLTLVTTAQSIVFTTIAVVGRAPPDGVLAGPAMLEILLAIAAVAFSSAMIGLVVSAVVDNPDKTMPPLVLVTMAQLVLTGGLTPVVGKPGLEQLSYLAPARWGYAAVASVTDLNTVQRLGDPRLNPGSVADPMWEHTAATYLTDVGGCVAVGVAAILATALLLRRLDPKIIRHARRSASSLHDHVSAR